MKGISPLIASVLLIAITMTLAAILATFVSNYTRQQLSALPTCVGGTLVYATSAYPKITGTSDTVTAVVEVENVDLTGFTVEVLQGNTIVSKDGGDDTIKAGSAGTITAIGFSGLTAGTDKARIIAKNCPTVKTDWVSLK